MSATGIYRLRSPVHRPAYVRGIVTDGWGTGSSASTGVVRAGLGSKARAWAWLLRARACSSSKPGPIEGSSAQARAW